MVFTLDNWVISKLSEPFREDEVKWRVGNAGMIMAYIDARQVVERLNYVVGAENWDDRYEKVEFTDTAVKDVTDIVALQAEVEKNGQKKTDFFWTDKFGNVTGVKNKALIKHSYIDIKYGGIECALTVLGVTKHDVGTISLADQMKGAHSDALKRAAVKFGIGAYLYDLKNLKGGRYDKGIVLEPPELPEWAIPVKRGDPDVAIQNLIKEIKAMEKTPEQIGRFSDLMSSINIMGSYNYSAPLIQKRYYYENLLSLKKELIGGDE